MGLAASQARFLLLTSRKSDLEFEGQSINQKRMGYANMVSSLQNLFATNPNLNNPESPFAQMYQNEISRIQNLDKKLELDLRRVDTQQQAVQTEIQAVQKVIDKNIDMSFKTFA
ncbi:MAG: hypothetical protein AB1782_13355 [Cyanobacteriota bacterium]